MPRDTLACCVSGASRVTDPVTWGALAFVAGVVVTSVIWTTAFWMLVPSRSEMETLAARVRDLEMKPR